MRPTRCRRYPRPQWTMASFASTTTRKFMTRSKFTRSTSLGHLVLISILLCAHLGLGVVHVVQGFERSNRDGFISYKQWKDEMQHAFRRHFPLNHQQSSQSSTFTSKRQRRNRTDHHRHHATKSAAEEDQEHDTTIETVGPRKGVFKLLRRRLMRTSVTVIEGVRPSMLSSSSSSSSSSFSVVVPSRNTRKSINQIVSLVGRGGSLPPPLHVLDHCGRFVAVGLGWVVVLQCAAAVVKIHGDALFEVCVCVSISFWSFWTRFICLVPLRPRSLSLDRG
jgi:predicted transposase YbfD/YdcC